MKGLPRGGRIELVDVVGCAREPDGPEVAGRAARRDAPPLLLIVAGSVLLNLVPTAYSLVIPSFDAQTHLFMADHYAHAWFDPWEPRWFCGFWMYSYPPLLHQLVALVGKACGLETAYRMVQLAIFAALPVSVWMLACRVAGRASAGWAACLSVVSAAPYVCVYTFGQLPTLLAVMLAFASVASLLAWLREGRGADLAAWSGLSAATLAAHQLTGLIALPGMVAAALAQAATEPQRDARLWRRTGLAAACAIALSGLALLPFFWWLHAWQQPQAEIPHATRQLFLLDPAWRFIFFSGIWGAGLPALAPALWLCLRRRELWGWALLLLLWTTLGLGTITPLPRLLFPSWSHWLTYERFTMWAAILVVVPSGLWLVRQRSTRLIVIVVFAAVAAFCAVRTSQLYVTRAAPSDASLAQMARFLDERAEWRYLTVGLGEEAMAHLNRLTRASTVDGLYFTARHDPLLDGSGIGALDAALWFKERGATVLRSVLYHCESYNLRWALSRGAPQEAILRDARWRRLGTVSDTGFVASGAEGEVAVWEAPPFFHVRPLDSPASPASPEALRWIWGLCPLAALFLGVAAACKGRR